MISYRPGTWFGIVGEHATVLLPPSEKARAGTLWVLIDDGAGFDEVLDALLADGLRALPGFVLLTEEGSTTRIVVRGPSRATFDTFGGEAVVEGSASATWVEKTLRDVTGLSVVLEETDEPLMTLRSGLVRLAELVSPVPAAEPATPAAAPNTTAPAPAPIHLAPQPDASGPYAAVLPFPAGVPAPPVAPPPPSIPVPATSDPLGLDPLGLGDLGAPQEPEHAPEPQQEPERTPVDEPADVSDEPADGPADEPSDELDVPEWLASSDPLSDQAEDYQDAAGRAEDDEAWADEPTGVLPVVPASDVPAADASDDVDEPTGPISAEPPAWTPPAPPAPTGGLPGAVPPPPPFPPVPPIAEAAPVPPAPLAPPVPQGGHDGLTPVGEPELEQPSVPAAAEQRVVARLEFAHGERVDVDRVVIIGRAPEAGRFSQADQPRLVAVPSPHQEISSTHIEIRPGSGADHGSAVVTDLGSTNGTVVVQPGVGPEDLRPGVPVPLAPGAMIDLGDGMTIRVTQP